MELKSRSHAVDRESGTKRSAGLLPGDPAGLHETGRISSSLADGRVAARAAPSPVVVGAARAVPLPVAVHTRRHVSEVIEVNQLSLGALVSCSPGVVLPAVRRLGLAGPFVSGGGRARRRAAAAPRAASLPEAVFAATGLVLLPA